MVCLGMTDTVTAGTGVVCTSVVCVGAGTLIVVAIMMDGGCWLRVASAALAWVLFSTVGSLMVAGVFGEYALWSWLESRL